MSATAQANKLMEERAGLWEEQKKLLDKAESENRDLTTEEATEYDKREQAMESLEKRANRLTKNGEDGKFERAITAADEADTQSEWQEMTPEEKRAEQRRLRVRFDAEEYRKQIADGVVKAPLTLKEFNEMRSVGRPQDDPFYRWAFYRMLTVRDLRELVPDELRALSKATAGAGANLVPTEFARVLVDALREVGVMRQVSRIITTDSGESMQVPSVSSHGTAAWTAENAAFTESDEAFGQASLSAFKAATIMKVSEELLQDAAFDLEAYIRQEFGMRIGILENTAYLVGDGTGKPTGVATTASAGVTAATNAAITADELIDLYHSLLSPYRRNAVFIVKDSTMKAVRKLKDTTNQYIWQPGLQMSEPDVLLGKPIYTDPDMAAIGTVAVSALFGDFSYYWIRDVNGIQFQRLNELYAANGQVGFRAYHRTDGKLMNTAAVKKLTHPA